MEGAIHENLIMIYVADVECSSAPQLESRLQRNHARSQLETHRTEDLRITVRGDPRNSLQKDKDPDDHPGTRTSAVHDRRPRRKLLADRAVSHPRTHTHVRAAEATKIEIKKRRNWQRDREIERSRDRIERD